MTVAKVRKEINAALQSANRVSKAEAERIVTSAQDGKVTAAESRLITDLFEKASGSAPSMTAGARNVFDEFFLRYGLPCGSGLALVQDRIRATLSTVKLGEPLAKAPNTSNASKIELDADHTAYLNIAKGSFYLKDTSSGAARWYGPIDLKAASATSQYADIAKKVLAEYGLDQMSVCISDAEATRQAGLGGTVGFEQALRASLDSFLNDGAESGSFLNQFQETGPVDGAPEDPQEATRFFLNRASSTLALVSATPTDDEKSKGAFPPENGETVAQNWIFSAFAPDLSGSLHWAVTDRTGTKPTYNYGFD